MKQTHKRQIAQGPAVSALAAGRSIEEAADEAGVHPSTVYRWLDRDDFQSALARAKGEPVEKPSWDGNRIRRPPYYDEPNVRTAAAAYLQAARDHFGPDIPVCTHTSVPDPRFWLSREMPRSVARAAREWDRVRREALRSWREERAGAQAR